VTVSELLLFHTLELPDFLLSLKIRFFLTIHRVNIFSIFRFQRKEFLFFRSHEPPEYRPSQDPTRTRCTMGRRGPFSTPSGVMGLTPSPPRGPLRPQPKPKELRTSKPYTWRLAPSEEIFLPIICFSILRLFYPPF